MKNTASLRNALDSLRGKSVIVTGGGRGLGRSISEGFAAEGAHVTILGRDADTLKQAAAAMRSAGGMVNIFAANMASEDDVEAAVEHVCANFGGVDVVINNAGVNRFYKRAEHTSFAEWKEIIDINLSGVFLMCRAAGRRMLEAGSGSIINITSVAARTGLARTTAYCAAKGSVEMLTKQLALEWAKNGVRVNAVGPGYFETDLTEGLRKNDSLSEPIVGRTPMGRFGKPDELVGACLYLASPAASYVTGQALMIDGGWTAC